jgi:hypothetical protein
VFVFSGRTDYETGIKPASHRLERHAPACASAPPPKGPATTPTPAHQQPPDHVKISLFHSRHYRPPPPPSIHAKVTHHMESFRRGTLTMCLCHEPKSALQRNSHICIPFLGIARPQSQFPHSCVCERFTYFQDRSTYFLRQNRQIDPGICKSLTDT